MIIFKLTLSLFLLPFVASKYMSSINSYTLHGIVSDKTTGKPLQNIYLYTVKGVEEAMTDQRGEFKIVTWQKLPVAIYVHYSDSENIKVIVANPSKKIMIKY